MRFPNCTHSAAQKGARIPGTRQQSDKRLHQIALTGLHAEPSKPPLQTSGLLQIATHFEVFKGN